MNETNLLIGSLSNDLLRVANMIFRGSNEGALCFWKQAQKWNCQLKNHTLKSYVSNIITDIEAEKEDEALSLEKAEKYLMYSILLQNYILHN